MVVRDDEERISFDGKYFHDKLTLKKVYPSEKTWDTMTLQRYARKSSYIVKFMNRRFYLDF